MNLLAISHFGCQMITLLMDWLTITAHTLVYCVTFNMQLTGSRVNVIFKRVVKVNKQAIAQIETPRLMCNAKIIKFIYYQ